MVRKSLTTLRMAGRIVFAERLYQGIGVAIFLGFLVLYLFTLPATYTGGRIGLVSLRFLTPTLAGFAVVMAGLVAVIVPFTAYTLRLNGDTGTTATASGVVGSILPPLLCCSPLLPTLAAAAVGVFPAAFGVSGFIQGFIATHEPEILTAAILVLAYAAVQNAKGVTQCTR